MARENYQTHGHEIQERPDSSAHSKVTAQTGWQGLILNSPWTRNT